MHTTEQPWAAVPGGWPPAGGWFPGIRPGPGPDPALRLICFPYAGGTPSVYRGWPEHLGDRVHVVPVLLPGRGLRLREEPYTEMAPLAADIATALVEQGLASRYAMFGHSMGALLAYEVACELRRRGEAGPLHLFVSGSRAPHLYGERADHTLSDDDLRQMVRDIGGLGADDTIGSSYLERRLPVLRADLTACERYRWTPRRPLDCPMTAFSAADDPIAPVPGVEAWREYTRGSLLRRHLTGGHFYLNGPSRLPLLRELRGELDRLDELDRLCSAPAGPAGPAPDARDRLLTPNRDSSWTY